MAGRYRPKQWTTFMPNAARRLLLALVPLELAILIVDMARDVDLPAWDPYGFWAAAEPEFDKNGEYGWVPMVDTCLPLF